MKVGLILINDYQYKGTNALLSSQKITTSIRQADCFICDCLFGLINSDPNTVKSARPLKSFVANNFDDDYKTNRQQDCGEFINYLVSYCSILKRLTKFSVHTTYKCKICGTLSNSVDDRNVRYQNVIGDSIDEILSLEESVPPVLKECKNCKKNTSHAELEAYYELPDVLIICLKRFEQVDGNITKNCKEVEPTPLLHHDQGDTVYALKSVVTHFGPHTNVGHYITALHINDSQWIYCNDEITSIQNEIPKMGYLFVYEKINESPLALPIDINDEQVASTSFVSQPLSECSNLTKRLISSSSEEDEISSRKDERHQRKKSRSEGLVAKNLSCSRREKNKLIPSLLKKNKTLFKKPKSSKKSKLRQQQAINMPDNITENAATYLEAKLPSETESEDEVVTGADQKATTFDSKAHSGKIQLDNSETVSKDSENSDNEEFICIGCKTGPIKQKNIFRHFAKTKKTTNCEKIYQDLAEDLLNRFKKNSELRQKRNDKKKSKKYREKNKGKKAKADKIYQQKNKGKKAKAQKKYQQKNKGKKAKTQKKYEQKNKEEISLVKKDYFQQNKEDISEQQKSYREEKKQDLPDQLKRFRKECQGPIFTCCCCMRDLFQRSVEEIKGPLEKMLTEKNMLGYLNFDQSLKIKDEFQFESETKRIREGFSLCKTCISYLKKSKMPPMCWKNNLAPAKIPNCLKKLSDLEKQLITKNLIFIKVRQLPKTRMNCINDRVINIPISDDNISKNVSSLPRNEDNSCLVYIGLKRKLDMKNYHKHGMINPENVFEACIYLINHHPEYRNVKLESYEDWI